RPYCGMQFFTDSMQVHTHAQNTCIKSSDNSYNAIAQERIFSSQIDLNSDYTATISNQDTTHINFIDNTSLLSHNNFLFPNDNRVTGSFLSTSYLNSLSNNSELSNLSNSNSDDYHVHNQRNELQLFYIDSAQDDSPAQNIHIKSSEYFNNSNQKQFRIQQPTQQRMFSPQAELNADYTAAISNQDTTHINFIDNTPLLSYNNFLFPKDNRVAGSFLSTSYLNNLSNNSELSNLSNSNSDDYHVHNQRNEMQLFNIDSAQDDSPAQNIHFT
ncbi:1170_t:CDS:1, partial [Cetraspora pellucida]